MKVSAEKAELLDNVASSPGSGQLGDSSALNSNANIQLLPPELLLEIFLHCLPERTQNLPPKPGEAPWLIGRVCSRWRFISHSYPKLWRKTMLNIDTTRHGYSDHSPQTLHAATTHLPSAAFLSVTYCGTLPDIAPTLIPYLWRIQHLSLRLTVDSYEGLWNLVSPDVLSEIQILELRLIDGGQMGNRKSRWERFKLFGLSRSLRRLTMDTSPLFPLSSLDFPWKQLESLNINAHADLAFRTSFSVLRNCTSLKELTLRTFGAYDPLIKQASADETRVKTSLLLGLDPMLNNLSVLNLSKSELLGEVLHGILRQCTQLVTLYSPLPLQGKHVDMTQTIHLPHLKTLYLSYAHDSWLFELLLLPSLNRLSIQTNISLDLSVIQQMLVLSACSLSSFAYQARYAGGGFYGASGTPTGDLGALLATIPSATHIDTGRDFIVSEDCLKSIAAGVLLPKLEYFRGQPASLVAFLDMIESRVDNDARAGRVTLRDAVSIGLRPRPTAEEEEQFTQRLSVLYERYERSIQCTLVN